MKPSPKAHRPRMRTRRLMIDDLPDEVLVYDLDRHRAHCLNRTAALIWRHCDGRTSAAQIARHLEKQLKAPVSEDLVWLALRQLTKLHLLEEPVSLPAQVAGISRRQMVRSLGMAAVVALPLVTSGAASGDLDCLRLKHRHHRAWGLASTAATYRAVATLVCSVTAGLICVSLP